MFSIVELNGVSITESGELKVLIPEPAPPPNTTQVSDQYIGTHNGIEYNEFEIDNGKRLVIQRVMAGAERNGDGTFVRIVDRGLDDLQWVDLILPIFINGGNFQMDVSIEVEATGNPDGTGTESRWIELLVENDRNSYCGARWVGYLEDI